MLINRRTHLKLTSLVAIAICGGLASVLSFVLREAGVSSAVPLMFLLVLIPLAHFLGLLPGILGAVAAGTAFALVLFPPFGSLAVRDAANRIHLLLFGIAAVGVCCLSSRIRTD